MFGYLCAAECDELSAVWVWASYCFSCLLVSSALDLGFSVLVMLCLVLRYALLVLLELAIGCWFSGG